MPIKLGCKTWQVKAGLKKIGVGGRIMFKQNVKN
jgi:hypothetical protein